MVHAFGGTDSGKMHENGEQVQDLLVKVGVPQSEFFGTTFSGIRFAAFVTA
jgi:hypothetical protein